MTTNGHTEAPVSYLHSFSQILNPRPVTQTRHDEGCSSLQEPAKCPHIKPLSFCVWPERLTCCAVLIKCTPLWLVASLWCEVWLKVRGCLFASLWDQPTCPCLCFNTEPMGLHHGPHVPHIRFSVGVWLCAYEKKKFCLTDCSDEKIWRSDNCFLSPLTWSLLLILRHLLKIWRL